jgi:hypothetical protein
VADELTNFDPAQRLPLYGCLTGIELPFNVFEVARGITLRRAFIDTFGAQLMAFAPPLAPNKPHPPPWAAFRGGFMFKSRVEVSISDTDGFNDLPPSLIAWLVAALLRLQVYSPVRLSVLGNMPLSKIGENSREGVAVAFEAAPNQIGIYKSQESKVTPDDLAWLKELLPVAARLYDDERFARAFSVYEQAQWSPTIEMSAVLVWTAIEALFDLGAERDKTRAICKALSDYVSTSRADRDRAYQVIQDLYKKRGRVVHVGRSVDPSDFMQSLQLARVAFRRVLIDGELPMSPDFRIQHFCD